MAEGMKQFGFTVLGSGSEGNATVIHCPEGNLLLDAGFSRKELFRRMDASGINPETIKAVFLTHSHTDHCKGMQLFANELEIPVYETAETAQIMSIEKKNAEKCVVITPGSRVSLCGTVVSPFEVMHDVSTVAYTFQTDGRKIGYATDLGFASLLVLARLKDCNALILESNFDPKMLHDSTRPLRLKRRIMGKSGHLSNQDSMSAVTQVVSESTKQLVFAHLSRECNRPELVQSLANETLMELRRTDISVSIATQQAPLPTYWV